MIEIIMDELAEIEGGKKMNQIEELERKIQYQEEMIEEIKKRNPNSEDLSFDEYQLYCMKKELEELKNAIK